MSHDSCPRCAALAPAGADRCGVCLLELRPSVPTAVDPLTAPLSVVEDAYLPTHPPREPLVTAYAAPPVAPYVAPPSYAPPTQPPAAKALPDLEWRAVVRREEPATAEVPARRPQPQGPRDPNARPTWPCLRCGGDNDVDLDACVQCGAGFLQGIEGVDIEIPVLGNVTKLERPHKVALVLGVGTGVVVLFLLVATLLGMIF